MRDFTPKTLTELLITLQTKGYNFQPFAAFLRDPAIKSVILRHDVDARKMNSLLTAQIEKELGISGTYYFRMIPSSFDEEVIKEIAGMGHEIGYHYEDVSLAAERRKFLAPGSGLRARSSEQYETELLKIAIENFKDKLQKLRKIVPVETICMHGSPLSRWDNRLLWEYFDYRDYGIIGEPYFDIDFNDVLYLTDTGRRWDGEAVSIRDRVHKRKGEGEMGGGGDGETRSGERQLRKIEGNQPSARFHSTSDIIKAAKENRLPDKIMITIHPQRWDDQILPWLKELVWQNIKNVGKRVIIQY